MTIRPVTGEPFRFEVDSASRPGTWHLVDLQALRHNGWCGCEDFEARRNKKLRENGGTPSDESRCIHIRAVREMVLDRLLELEARRTGLVEEPF